MQLCMLETLHQQSISANFPIVDFITNCYINQTLQVYTPINLLQELTLAKTPRLSRQILFSEKQFHALLKEMYELYMQT